MAYVLRENVEEETFYIDEIPYQKGKYRYVRNGNRITIEEIGSGENETAPIVEGNFSDFERYIKDMSAGGAILPFISMNQLISYLNDVLSIDRRKL